MAYDRPRAGLITRAITNQLSTSLKLATSNTRQTIHPLKSAHQPLSPTPPNWPIPGPTSSGSPEPTRQPPTDRPQLDSSPSIAPVRAQLRHSASVPSSKLGRLAHYTSLLGGLGIGLATDKLGAFSRGNSQPHGGILSPSNGRRLVDKLSLMRGAALKVGQFLAIQDSSVVPDQLRIILQKVQDQANFMPFKQTNKVMIDNLGPNWPDLFDSFEEIPFAAASIGQVHQARLAKSSEYPNGLDLAVKVQFPGVRESIESDLSYLKWLLLASAALPRGLYLENTIKVLGKELDDECDYQREALAGIRMAHLIDNSALKDTFRVARVISELSGKSVLTTELMRGQSLNLATEWEQHERDLIGNSILQLSLSELFSFGLMQTDPNSGNFLFDRDDAKLELIDFGATREYDQSFINLFYKLLSAAVEQDEPLATKLSLEIGYLTGEESDLMVRAHLDSLFALASPFTTTAPDPFNFSQLGPPITNKIRQQIPIMLANRLTPPPDQTYSLNRKLSGAFLLCERLGSNVHSRNLLAQYKPSPVTA